MPRTTVKGTEEAGFLPASEGDANVVPLFVEVLADEAEEELGSKEEVESEISAMLRLIRTLHVLEPDAAMQVISAYSARLTQIYVLLHRIEGRQREWRQVRTQQVVPMLQEMDRQFKQASRLLEVRRQDLEAMRGMR